MKNIILTLTVLFSSSALASHWGEYNTKEEAKHILNICSDQVSVLNDNNFYFQSGEYVGNLEIGGGTSTIYWVLFSSLNNNFETLVVNERYVYSEESTIGITTEWKCEIKSGNQVQEY